MSSEFIRSLSDSIDYTTMAKLMGAISVFMGVFDGIISRGRSVSRESLDMFRGLTVLVFVQITLKAVHERSVPTPLECLCTPLGRDRGGSGRHLVPAYHRGAGCRACITPVGGSGLRGIWMTP